MIFKICAKVVQEDPSNDVEGSAKGIVFVTVLEKSAFSAN